MRTDNKSKLSGFIGMAKKAGKAEYGTDKLRDMIRRSSIKLVLLSDDASDNTEKRMKNCCVYYGVKCIKTDMDSAELGKAIGAHGNVVCIGVTDDGFSDSIEKMIDKSDNAEVRS